MIKIKFILFLCLMLFAVVSYAENSKNFVSVLNGAVFAKAPTGSSLQASSFLGQSLVFDSLDTLDLVAQSGFASVISKVQSSSISFSNNTPDEKYKDIIVNVKVDIKTSIGNITKVRYKISQGSNQAWEEEQNYPDSDSKLTPAAEINFAKDITFSRGEPENYIQIYAQYESGSEYAGSWSPAYTIKLDSSLSDVVKFTSPDPLTKLSSIDPTVTTTEFSVNLTSATITLYEGTISKLYSISVSSSSGSDVYGIYNKELGAISYLNSAVIKKYNEINHTNIPVNLKSKTKYKLEIKSQKTGGEEQSSSIEFTALGGGVADILTYPSPFDPNKEKIKIRYILAKDSRVTIKLYNKAGKIVKKLEQSTYQNAGTNEVEWDGRNYAGETLATGAYICEIIANSSDGEHRRYTALAIVGR